MILLLLFLWNKSLIRFHEILYEAIATISGVFISKHIFDVGDLYLFSVLFLFIGCVTNLGLNMQSVIVIHLLKASLLLFQAFEIFWGVDYLNLSLFIYEIEDINIVFFFLGIVVSKNGFFIILFTFLFCRFLVVEIRKSAFLSSYIWPILYDTYVL